MLYILSYAKHFSNSNSPSCKTSDSCTSLPHQRNCHNIPESHEIRSIFNMVLDSFFSSWSNNPSHQNKSMCLRKATSPCPSCCWCRGHTGPGPQGMEAGLLIEKTTSFSPHQWLYSVTNILNVKLQGKIFSKYLVWKSLFLFYFSFPLSLRLKPENMGVGQKASLEKHPAPFQTPYPRAKNLFLCYPHIHWHSLSGVWEPPASDLQKCLWKRQTPRTLSKLLAQNFGAGSWNLSYQKTSWVIIMHSKFYSPLEFNH